MTDPEKRKAGRPVGTTGAYKDVTKCINISIRVTEEEREQLKQNAAAAGKTMSDYILSRCL